MNTIKNRLILSLIDTHLTTLMGQAMFILKSAPDSVHDDIGSYGYDNHGCFRASDAEGRFFGLISSKWATKSMKPWSPIGSLCLKDVFLGIRYSNLLLSCILQQKILFNRQIMSRQNGKATTFPMWHPRQLKYQALRS